MRVLKLLLPSLVLILWAGLRVATDAATALTVFGLIALAAALAVAEAERQGWYR